VFSLHVHLASNNLIRGPTVDQSGPGEWFLAARANAPVALREVFDNAFDVALYKLPFFAVSLGI